mgnify:FL=1
MPLFADLEPLSPAVPVSAVRGQRSLTPQTVRQQLPADAASPLLHAAVFLPLPAACVRKQQIITCSYSKMRGKFWEIKGPCDLIRGGQIKKSSNFVLSIKHENKQRCVTCNMIDINGHHTNKFAIETDHIGWQINFIFHVNTSPSHVNVYVK